MTGYTMVVAWRRFRWWPVSWPLGIRYDTWDRPDEPDWDELRKIVEEEGIVIVSIDPPPPPSAGILIQDGPS